MPTNLTDEDIDSMRETMATTPIGAIADAVWGVADDPDEHEELIADSNGAIREYVISEAAAKGWAPGNEQQLAGIIELIAKAMIAQHLFTGTITLSPFMEGPVADPPALAWFAGLK